MILRLKIETPIRLLPIVFIFHFVDGLSNPYAL